MTSPERGSRLQSRVLVALGIAALLAAVIPDLFGRGARGFGLAQLFVTAVGILIIFVGILVRSQRLRSLRWFRVLQIWMLILVVGLFGIELAARKLGGFRVLTRGLKADTYSSFEERRIYNSAFYESHREHFASWPHEPDLFEADDPSPAYLYKANFGPIESERFVWSTNSWGFRGPEFPVEKPTGTLRVICLGASTTEGQHDDDQTYPHYLEVELQKLLPGRPVEVINAGHSGAKMADLLEVFVKRIRPLKPDLVVLYETSNNIEFQEFVGSGASCGVNECRIHSESETYRFLHAHSAVFQTIADSLRRNEERIPIVPHQFELFPAKPSAVLFKQRLEALVKEVQSTDTRIVLTSYLTLAREGFSADRDTHPHHFNQLLDYTPLTPREVERVYMLFNEKTAEVANEQGVPYLDIWPSYPRTFENFPEDLIHFSPRGNRVLAEQIARLLVDQSLTESGNQMLLQATHRDRDAYAEHHNEVQDVGE